MKTLQLKLETLLNENGLSAPEKCKLRQFIAMLTEFVSVLFRKTILLTVPKHEKEFIVSENAVMEFLAEALNREKGTGNPTPYVDNDIWGWDSFKGKKIPAMAEELCLAIYRFIKSITHRQILEEGEAKNIKRIGTFLEALATVKAAILAGEVEQHGTGVIAYFKVAGNDQLFRFYAWRSDDGQLLVNVLKVYLDRKYVPGDGVAFSN
jgi:hypothetical protein